MAYISHCGHLISQTVLNIVVFFNSSVLVRPLVLFYRLCPLYVSPTLDLAIWFLRERLSPTEHNHEPCELANITW
jgi:hypothetical protein